ATLTAERTAGRSIGRTAESPSIGVLLPRAGAVLPVDSIHPMTGAFAVWRALPVAAGRTVEDAVSCSEPRSRSGTPGRQRLRRFFPGTRWRRALIAAPRNVVGPLLPGDARYAHRQARFARTPPVPLPEPREAGSVLRFLGLAGR